MPVGTSDNPVRVERVDSRKRPVGGQWWVLKDSETHAGVFSVVDDLDKSDTQRLADNQKWSDLYDNRRTLLGFRPGRVRRTPTEVPGLPRSFTFNVIRSCIDTATAKVGQNRPKPLFLTEEGEASMQNRAKRLSKYVEGIFYDAKAYEVAQKVFRDACVFGTGVLYLYWDHDNKSRARLRFERVLPDELLIDEEEGRYGMPSQLHRRKWVLRDRLVEMFPKFEKEIMSARGERTDATSPSAVEHVQVVESWHLPSVPGAKDGRHSICIDGATLFSEKWEDDFFPFCFFHWSEPVVGFWGTGLAEELVGIQLEINRLCRDIAAAQRTMASPRIFVEAGSQIVPSHLAPGLQEGRLPIVKYVGRPPAFQTPPAISGEIYQSLDRWIQRAYEVTGISQLQATGRKPAGLDSGAALREYNDQVSERFVTVSQRWEEFFMDIARKSVSMSKTRYESGDKMLAIVAAEQRFIRTIKWKDVDLEADKFFMKVFPTNLLPSTPAGRLQQVVELLQAELLPRELALSLLDFPDVESFVSLETAALDDIRWTIEQILEDGKPGSVDELTNLALAQQLGMAAVLRAKRMNYPEENVELLRRWVDAVTDKLTPPPPPEDQMATDATPVGQMLPQGAEAGGPALPANPLPAPTNDLLPVSDPTAKSMIQPMSGPSTGASMMQPTLMQQATNFAGGAQSAGVGMPDWVNTVTNVSKATSGGSGGMDAQKAGMLAGIIGKAMAAKSDPKSKAEIERLDSAPPAEMMKSLEGGVTFHYKPGIPGEDPSEQKFGTTTTHLKSTEMGNTMVKVDPETGLEVISVKDAIGPILASLSNLDARFRVVEKKLGLVDEDQVVEGLPEVQDEGASDTEE